MTRLTWSCSCRDEGVVSAHAVPQHHEGLHHRPPVRVRGGDRRRLEDVGVLDQGALDLEGSDAVAGGDDHVVGPSDEPEVAVLVPVRAIAGQVPVAEAAASGRGLGSFQYSRNRPGGCPCTAISPTSPAGRTSPLPSITSTRWPGIGSPMEPGRTGTPGKFPTNRMLSVCP